jgi:hypothetical protein
MMQRLKHHDSQSCSIQNSVGCGLETAATDFAWEGSLGILHTWFMLSFFALPAADF